ncbi:hypothetical protein D3C75_628300 [compost metagenome]
MIEIITGNDSKSVKLSFGSGDIGVTAHSINNEETHSVTGMVLFNNQNSREIGSVGGARAGQEFKETDFPVVMSFTDPYSIDVVMQQLKLARNLMMNNNPYV